MPVPPEAGRFEVFFQRSVLIVAVAAVHDIPFPLLATDRTNGIICSASYLEEAILLSGRGATKPLGSASIRLLAGRLKQHFIAALNLLG